MTERTKIDGKAFVKSLGECKTKEEVFGLLGRTLGSEKMKDRVTHVSALPHIVKLNSRIAMLSAMQGKNTSSQDCMEMAAQKYIDLHHNNEKNGKQGDLHDVEKTLKCFKLEVNKYATQLKIKEDKDQERKQDHLIKSIQKNGTRAAGNPNYVFGK